MVPTMCQALWRQTGPGLESTTSSEEVRHQENKYLILLTHESTAVTKSTVRGVLAAGGFGIQGWGVMGNLPGSESGSHAASSVSTNDRHELLKMDLKMPLPEKAWRSGAQNSGCWEKCTREPGLFV